MTTLTEHRIMAVAPWWGYTGGSSRGHGPLTRKEGQQHSRLRKAQLDPLCEAAGSNPADSHFFTEHGPPPAHERAMVPIIGAPAPVRGAVPPRLTTPAPAIPRREPAAFYEGWGG